MIFFRRQPQLQGMTDIHNHVLPCIDDGASDIEASLAMLQNLAQAGFTAVSVSCHLGHPTFPDVSVQSIHDGVELIRQKLDSAGIAIELYAGAENYCDENLLPRFDAGQLLSVGGNTNWYLIEFSNMDPMLHMQEIAFQLSMRGVRPILAHPERYHALMRKPALANIWKDCGWSLQLDLGHLLYRDNWEAHKLARSMLNQGIYDLAATDLHQPSGDLPKMLRALVKIVGIEEATRLMVSNPHRILANQSLEEIEFDS
jgi:protein-tyrosine phosphatase